MRNGIGFLKVLLHPFVRSTYFYISIEEKENKLYTTERLRNIKIGILRRQLNFLYFFLNTTIVQKVEDS
jgi:hypothetical protein